MDALFTFRQGHEIDHRDAGVGILQKYWKAFAPGNVSEWNERISNSSGYVVAAYIGNAIVGVLEAIRLNIGGDPQRIPTTFDELTANGTWRNHTETGDTVVLVDLTIAPAFHGVGLFEAFAHYAREMFESPSRVIFTYSPLFFGDQRYQVVQKHERLGAKLTRELARSRPGLTMTMGGKEIIAEDVGITAYTV